MNIEGLPLEGLGIGSGWLLVCIGVVLIFRGRLIPASSVERELAAAAAAVEKAEHDRDEWRSESRIKDAQLAARDEQIAEKDRQLAHMGEVGRTQKAVLTALQALTPHTPEVTDR